MTRTAARGARLLAATGLLALVASQGSAQEAAPANCPEMRKIPIGVSVIPPLVVHTTPYIAQDLGIFAKYCLEAEIIAFEGGQSATAMAAVQQGKAVATVGHIAIARGMPAKQIWGLAPQLPQMYVVSGDVKTPADLKGKRLSAAGGGVGGFNWNMGREVLRANGLTEEDVHFVPGALSGLVPGVVTKQLDGFAGHPEDLHIAQQQDPSIHALVAMTDVLPNWMYNAYGASNEYIAANRDLLVDFVAAMIETNRLIYQEKDKVIPLMVKYTEKPQDAVEHAWEVQTADCIWSVNSGFDKARTEWSIEKSISNGDIEAANKPSFEDVVDESISRDALAKVGGPIEINGCKL